MAFEITDANFDETIKAGVTLVDFWAPWCGPCLALGPTIERIAEAYNGKATIGKLNVDDNADTAVRFAVMSIPTLIVFKDGQKMQQLSPPYREDQIKKAIDAHL